MQRYAANSPQFPENSPARLTETPAVCYNTGEWDIAKR